MANKKPNVLIFFTDDQRFDTISATGNKEINTPNFDAFAKDSVTFTHGHIMGGTCGAVCMPSRAMLQTGRDVFSLHGEGKKNGGMIPPEHLTMPEYLKDNGYNTYHVGKWHQDKASFNRSYTDAKSIFGFGNSPAFTGRSDWYSIGGHYTPVLFDYDSSGEYIKEHAFQMAEGLEKIGINEIKDNQHSTDTFVETALELINNYDDDKPFYMYLATVAPHDPRNAPQKYEEMYSPDTVATPPNFMQKHPFDNGELLCRDELLEFFPRREYAIRRHISDYYSIIAHIDARFGDLMQALKDKGLYDDTVIIFAGDNGLALGQHGLMGKQSVYDHSIRVPLMIKPAGDFTRKYTDAYAYLFDLFPTVCDLCGIQKPDSVNGTSLAPILDGTTDDVNDGIFAIYRNLQRTYKNKQYKIIQYYVKENELNTQLFDLVADPHELTNLASDPAYAQVLAEMQQKLAEKQKHYNDPLVTCTAEKLAENIW